MHSSISIQGNGTLEGGHWHKTLSRNQNIGEGRSRIKGVIVTQCKHGPRPWLWLRARYASFTLLCTSVCIHTHTQTHAHSLTHGYTENLISLVYPYIQIWAILSYTKNTLHILHVGMHEHTRLNHPPQGIWVNEMKWGAKNGTVPSHLKVFK